MSLREEEGEEEEDLTLSQSPMAKSSFYKTNHSTSVGMSTAERPWMSPSPPNKKRASFVCRGSLAKNTDTLKLSTGEHLSPRKKYIKNLGIFETSP